MKSFSLKAVALAALALGMVAISTNAAHAQTAYAIANGGTSLISFSVNNPSAVTLVGNFSGAGFPFNVAALDSIDFRPATGELYGYLNSTATTYRVNLTTAALTAVGSPLTTPTNTNILDMDFNPTADLFRIVTESTQNIVVNPSSGAAQGTPSPLEYAIGDPNQNQFALINGNAYTNNLPGATTTTQYAIDHGLNQLSTLNNNGGQLTSVGTGLGVDVNQAFTGFDIYTSLTGVNTGYAIFGTEFAPTFHTINLNTGVASSGTAIGGGYTGVYSLAIAPAAVVPEAGTLSLLLGGILTTGVGIVIRRRAKK